MCRHSSHIHVVMRVALAVRLNDSVLKIAFPTLDLIYQSKVETYTNVSFQCYQVNYAASTLRSSNQTS